MELQKEFFQKIQSSSAMLFFPMHFSGKHILGNKDSYVSRNSHFYENNFFNIISRKATVN